METSFFFFYLKILYQTLQVMIMQMMNAALAKIQIMINNLMRIFSE